MESVCLRPFNFDFYLLVGSCYRFYDFLELGTVLYMMRNRPLEDKLFSLWFFASEARLLGTLKVWL